MFTTNNTIILLILQIIATIHARNENVLLTEVFKIVIDPPLFNWTYESAVHQYIYQPSLLDSPDLPSWIKYVFSEKHHSGFLYGVPPNRDNVKIPLQIVALNKKNYETRCEQIDIHISEKLSPAKFEVHMKIDNLNVDDIFDVDRMDQLKDIFRKQLWKNSEEDLYVTFLASAIQLGARKPLNPKEREGIVLRLGSLAAFSLELTDLQEEVKPLWKLPICPRGYKRTSVEKYFRDAGFAMDWCSFRLIDDNNSAMHQEGIKAINTEESLLNIWNTIQKNEVPIRSYVYEFSLSLMLPIVLLLILAFVLSFVLCFYHEGMHDEASEDFFANLFHICTDIIRSKETIGNGYDAIQYATINRATQSLRSLSNNRDMSLSPDPMLISRSHTNSPTSTISKGLHCRPSPPPYVRPKFKPGF